MTLPTYDVLAGVDREQLWGLIEQNAGPTWAATYEHRWERDCSTWNAIVAALGRAAAGEQAATPSPRPPRFLLPSARERLTTLSTVWAQNGPFGEVRLLERLGLVELEHDDTYVLAVVGGLGDRWAAKDRAKILRSDPELIDVVWRFFEVEGGGEISLTNVDKFSVGTSWKQVLGELVADGTLPRERVLACCVQALGRDFSAYRAGWFSAFLDSLEPQAAELATLQPQLRQLLGSPITATASLASRALKKVAAAGLMDDDSCQELAPALVGRTKGTALEVIRLLRGIARRRADLTRVVAETATAGLEHPHPDVQRAAVSLLEALGATDLITRSADLLAPTVRGQVTGNAGPGQAPDKVSAHPQEPAPSTASRDSAPVDLTPTALLVPSGADLTELVAALLEDAEDPMMVEAALAGLATTDERSLLTPLAKRATSLLKRDGFRGDHPVRAGFARLALIAAGVEERSRHSLAPDLPELLRGRLDHVADVVAGLSSPVALLATPSDTDGWVDPEAFVARLAVNPEPSLADLVGGLLRLAPNDRSAALNAFAKQGLTDETGDVVRHALGAPPPVSGAAAARTPAPWAAASRSRDPLADDPLLLAAGLTAPGQGRPVSGVLDLRLEPFTYTDARGTHRASHARFSVVLDDDTPGPATPPDHASGQRKRVTRADSGVSAAWVRWAVTTYPHDTEPVFTGLVLHVVEALDYWEVDHAIPRALTALAHHPSRVGPLGAITAAAGLAAQDGTHRVLGVDAVVALATRGTLDPHALATAMGSIAPATRLPRWAPSLEQVAQAVGSGYVVDVLTDLVPRLPRDTLGLVRLLDVLAEESTRISRPVSDQTLRQYLEAITGSSGAAATARRILAVR